MYLYGILDYLIEGNFKEIRQQNDIDKERHGPGRSFPRDEIHIYQRSVQTLLQM